MRKPRRSVRVTATCVAVFAVAIAVVTVNQASAGSGSSHTSATTASTAHVIALGADIKPASGQSKQTAITAFEKLTGHKLAYTRDFLNWDSPFPTSYETWLGARGTLPLISVKSVTVGGTKVPWAAIANAQPGSTLYNQIKGWADKIKAFGYPVYFTFNHEPEAAASTAFGTTADYIAAWRRIHDMFVSEGVTNAKFMWIMTSFAFLVPATDRRYGWNWYPGDTYVDAIGADAYTEYTCRYANGKWHPLSYQIAGFLKFGAQHPTKPMWLAEFGVVEDPALAGRKAQWITAAQNLFPQAAYQQFAGIAYFNETRPGTACDWHITTSTSATTAFSTLAQNPYYSGTAH